MPARLRLSLLFLSPLALVACSTINGAEYSGGTGAGSAGAGAAPAGNLPCDVDAVLQNNCQKCHSAPPQFGAPMPLVTYADLMALAPEDPTHTQKVYQAVEIRTHDDAMPMPQPPNPRLDATDQATLDNWINAGALPSSQTCGGTGGGGAGGGVPLPCAPNLELIPQTSYTMPTDTDDIYICYGIDVTTTQAEQAVAFFPHIDNSKIVHHILLFQTDETVAPGPTPCQFGGGGADWRIVTVWAPGGMGMVLPPQAGFPLSGTTHYAVQVHYNNLMHLSGEMDHSGFDVCTTTDLRPNDADVLAFGTQDINIPAHGTLDETCSYTLPSVSPQITLVADMPHMHKLGTIISTIDAPTGGAATIDLGTRDPWNFNTQFWTNLAGTQLGPGDKVSTRCAWFNPGATAVTFGEDTEDEMCFSFVVYYPKITLSQWNWGLPAFLSTCSPTPASP
jgi:Copper type II ascorbate-dependent monooxygenase, N-terminal domain/Copper type II ascorbate-dependent monooxygenase, C-terminal domain